MDKRKTNNANIFNDIIQEWDNGYIHYYFVVQVTWGGQWLEELCWGGYYEGFCSMEEDFLWLSNEEYQNDIHRRGIVYDYEIRSVRDHSHCHCWE